MHVPLVRAVELNVVLEERNTDVPQVEVLAHVLQNLRLNPHLGLSQRGNLLQQRSCELALHVRVALDHRCESDEVQEDFVEGLREVLLVASVQDVPVLPEDFAEDLLGDVLVLNVVLGVYSDDLSQWLHEVLQGRLRVDILRVLGVEGLEGSQEADAILRL